MITEYRQTELQQAVDAMTANRVCTTKPVSWRVSDREEAEWMHERLNRFGDCAWTMVEGYFIVVFTPACVNIPACPCAAH